MKKALAVFVAIIFCITATNAQGTDKQANKEQKREQKEIKKEEKASNKGKSGSGVKVSGKKGGGMDINKKGLNIKSKHGGGVRIGKGDK